MSSQNKEMLDAQGTEQTTLPDEIAPFIEKLPEEDRNTFKQLWVSQFSMISRISPEYDIARKVTSEHIDKLLDRDSKELDKIFKDRSQRRGFTLLLTVLASAVLIALVLLLKDNPEFMEKIITIAFSGILGAAGGYGLGINKNRNDN